MSVVYFLISFALGITLIKYSKWIVDNTSRIDIAEEFLGVGGSYSFWKIIGILAIMFAFWSIYNL